MLTKTSVVRCSRISSASAVVDLAPHLVGGDRAQFVARHFDRQVHLAPVADVDHAGVGRSETRATSSIGFTVAERPMRCGLGRRSAPPAGPAAPA